MGAFSKGCAEVIIVGQGRRITVHLSAYEMHCLVLLVYVFHSVDD